MSNAGFTAYKVQNIKWKSRNFSENIWSPVLKYYDIIRNTSQLFLLHNFFYWSHQNFVFILQNNGTALTA